MQQHQKGVQRRIDFYHKCFQKGKAVYYHLFPQSKNGKPKWVSSCVNILRAFASRPHRQEQDKWFSEIKESLLSNGRVMVFLVPEFDAVTGGVMSICNIASRSQKMKELHGCDVLLSTMPGQITVSKYTMFENDCKIFRFEQMMSLFDGIEELYIQIPEMYIAPFADYLKGHDEILEKISEKRLNILNQNIELMPPAEKVKELAGYFTSVTQTCAHAKYCTKEQRNLYGMPLHLLPAEIPGEFYQFPYSEKENLIAYSNDENPHKERVLSKLKDFLPDYRFLMIENMSYDEYRKTISRAKWTLTFGEGWDCYYIQPYFSRSIGFTVFNKAFCPEYMRDIPTVFPDYETLPERMTEFIKAYDKEELYSEILEEIRNMLFPPVPNAVPRDALLEFYKGNYTFP